MFVCCRRENGDQGTEGVDDVTAQSYPTSSPRPGEGKEVGENAIFGERKEQLLTGATKENTPTPASTAHVPSTGLHIVFREGTGGKDHVLNFERTPFGLNFQPVMPIRVTEVSGYAAELGVQPGWEVTVCGDVPLSSPNFKFSDALELLRVQAELLECRRAESGSKSVNIAFTTGGGEIATVNFTQMPLGIDFGQDVPMRVVAVNGQAAELGVQTGWEVKSVAGVALDDADLLFADAVEVVKEEIGRLEGSASPPMVAAASFPVGFTSGQTVTFHSVPLGFDVGQELPLKVADVSGQAAKLGVLSGWVLQSIGGAQLDDKSMQFADALALVKSKVARFEARQRRSQLMRGDGLPIVFGTPGGSVGVVFDKTPLGMDLSQCVPITVLSATGQAAELGVQPDWEILAVCGVAVVGARADAQSSLAILEAMVERLRVQSEARKSASQVFDEG